jgi:hypothetical protein
MKNTSPVRILNVSSPHENYLVNFSLRYGYIYVETPKVGCSTIKRILQTAEVNNDESRLPQDVHDRMNSPIPTMNRAPGQFRELLYNQETFRFCFVRNPFSRVLSCYLDKFVKDEAEKGRLISQLDVPKHKDLSFTDFLNAIRRQPDREKNIHWVPQSFLLNPHSLKYDFIGRFETMSADINYVIEALKLPVRSWQKNAPHATAAGSKLNRYYGRDEIRLVQEIYVEDFKSFGYGYYPNLAALEFSGWRQGNQF